MFSFALSLQACESNLICTVYFVFVFRVNRLNETAMVSIYMVMDNLHVSSKGAVEVKQHSLIGMLDPVLL